MLNRRRELVRGRTRPTANGNFIVIRQGGMVYALVFTPLKDNYVFYKTYTAPQPMPIGYTNQPLPKVLPKLLGTVTRPQDIIPADLTIPGLTFTPPNIQPVPPTPIASPVPIPQPELPTAASAQQVAAYDNGSGFALVLSTSPQRIYNSSVPCKLVVIVTDSANTGNVYINFNSGVAAGQTLKLPKGSSVSIPISDAGKIYILGENTTDKISGFYLV